MGRESGMVKATLKVRQMNGLESAYAQELELLRKVGEIIWWEFEACKIRLADNTFYTPDFAVVTKDHSLEFHETKGFWQEDARVKIKVAAERFPAKFKAITRAKKQWVIEEF